MKKYKWMEECIIVNGHVRSCIYDLSRQKSYFVDKNIKSLIQKIESLYSRTIKITLNDSELEWFNFFIEKELLFEVPISQFGNFRKISFDWLHPSKIVNAIIEDSIYLKKTLKFLNELNCHHIVLSFQNSKDIQKVLEGNFKTTFLKSLDIIVNKNTHGNGFYKELQNKHPIIADIFIKESNKKIITSKKSDFRRVLMISKSNKKNIILNIEIKLFMESIFHNVYLNRKIFINKEGNIYNSPESETILGNLTNINNSENLLKISQTKEWYSKKSNTYICEECELRNMCVDNRIPKLNKKNEKWYHETECDYNPYIGVWKKDKGYKSLNECGIEVTNLGVKINKEKLDKVNEMLWN